MQLSRHWPGGFYLSRCLHWAELELSRIGRRDGIARAWWDVGDYKSCAPLPCVVELLRTLSSDAPVSETLWGCP